MVTKASVFLFLAINAWGATAGDLTSGQTAASGPRTTMMAESAFKDYGLSVAVYVILITVLVGILLVGGFLVVNLALLSKRKVDRIGLRAPSDVGILKNTNWPEQEYETTVLPADEGEADVRIAAKRAREEGRVYPFPPIKRKSS